MIEIVWQQMLWLIPLGIAVGCIGTIIGAGGGFIIVPVLLLLYPAKGADVITSISLAVVCANATSGSIAYGRQKRIDYHTGFVFALATIPGAILGALTTRWIPRQLFNVIFGVVLMMVAVFLFLKPDNGKVSSVGNSKKIVRTIVDARGVTHTYSYDLFWGVIISLFVGYFASLLGIGGGIIHVPAMVHLLNFPVHIATATSHFALAIMAFVSTVVHLVRGDLNGCMTQVIGLVIGVIIGAPLGAHLSNQLGGRWIIRGLAGALLLVGLRLLIH